MSWGEARWNHNIHYHSLILKAVPNGARTALDVGCGEGLLARDLRGIVPSVTGIDIDPASIELARRSASGTPGLDFVLGDFLSYDLPPASFDVVASVAALHHMDTAAGLQRMCELLAPGGRLVVVDLARSRYPVDLPGELAAVVAHRIHRMTKPYWDHSAPVVWPPTLTYAEARRLAQDLLPGVRYRHHLLWRYSLTWIKPT